MLNTAEKFVNSYHFWTAITTTYISYSLFNVLFVILFMIQGSMIETQIGTTNFMISFIIKSILANLIYILLVVLLALTNQEVYKTVFNGLFPIYMMFFTTETVRHSFRTT